MSGAACGAARLGAMRDVPAEIDDVPVEITAPAELLPQQSAERLVVRFIKARRPSLARRPTHALCEGLGHVLDGQKVFTIGPAALSPDLTLPEEFDAIGWHAEVDRDHRGRLVGEAGTEIGFVDGDDGFEPGHGGGAGQEVGERRLVIDQQELRFSQRLVPCRHVADSLNSFPSTRQTRETAF